MPWNVLFLSSSHALTPLKLDSTLIFHIVPDVELNLLIKRAREGTEREERRRTKKSKTNLKLLDLLI